ncbi:unnamed protein product [Dracunculus medinensis]|uniref:N-acetyltransferase domain-containing protein n=1 Tax=Dracunculus medinensis TaxID=318479 RepID=A0A0N4U7M6_DRAME|nr:unnamed protein product [Dracunculus medinensis]
MDGRNVSDNGDDRDIYLLVALVDRLDLVSPCIELLNEEWPRSQAARENSLKKTISSKPPMSLIFLDRKLDKLIGHAKLCSIIGDDESCWIESVVITKKLRGRRLGARLINAVEKKASQFGFHKVYLSTTNKYGFYLKCGYEFCEPIFHTGANINLFKGVNALIFLPKNSNSKFEKKNYDFKDIKNNESDHSSNKSSKVNNIPSVHHIPLPPPLPQQSTACRFSADFCSPLKKQYMYKILK